jgi:hypothetical protein
MKNNIQLWKFNRKEDRVVKEYVPTLLGIVPMPAVIYSMEPRLAISKVDAA